MRFVIFGAGAVGGVIGARLHQSGREVMLIARGAHHDAIAERGLRLRTPSEDVTLALPVAPSASEAGITPDDVVLLCTKSQDTRAALQSIRDALQSIRDALPVTAERTAKRPGVPVVCVQNGIDNEREALRIFADVYAAVVMVPAEHLEPGVVIGYGSKLSGQLDVGRYPGSVDELTRELCAAFTDSGFESVPRADIMVHKHAKLLNNLFNAIEAICGQVDPAGNRELRELVLAEGREILTAAGTEFEVDDVRDLDQRWARIGVGEVDGHSHRGGSTWQSLSRGTGSVETDYLTGELVLIARQLGLAAPINELLQDLVAVTLHERRQPGWITPRELLAQPAATAAP